MIYMLIQLIRSFPRSEIQVAAQISTRLAHISQGMFAHDPQLNLDNTGQLFLSPISNL